MPEQDINIETLAIDIYVDTQQDAQQFLNKSVVELKQWVLPEIEKLLIGMNVLSEDQNAIASEDYDIETIEMEIKATSDSWKEQISEEISGLIKKNYESLITELKQPMEIGAGKQTRTSPSELDKTQTGQTIHLYTIFLKTGIIPRSKNGSSPLSLVELENKILESDATLFWKYLVPILRNNTTTIARFIRQSPRLWNERVISQFNDEIRTFVRNWMLRVLSEKEEVKTLLLQLLVDTKYREEQTFTFAQWKSELISYCRSNYTKNEISRIFSLVPNVESPESNETTFFNKEWHFLVQEITQHFDQTSDANNTVQQRQTNLPSEDVERILEQIVVPNAGIVLLHPFFPSLFKNLGFLNEKNQWKSEEMQVKAIYTLHYLATGETEVSEDQLLVEKLLTGYPIDAAIPLVEKEELVSEALDLQMAELLEVIRDNWKPMRNCTWQGLQADFLTRQAAFVKIDEMQYKLIIEPHLLDVLLPSKKWGISMVKYSWMEGFVYVVWG